jgi:membrane protein implicated in regulation of membrane protease activity
VESPETWRWIWLGAAVLFALGELALAGTFFLLPFALGALVASVLAFAGVALGIEWLAFVGVSALASLGFIPLRHRLDRNDTDSGDGIGARRLLGQPALVISTIDAGPHGRGMVRVGREEWRAETDDGHGVPTGLVVRVLEVRGTGVVVTSTPHERAGTTELSAPGAPTEPTDPGAP